MQEGTLKQEWEVKIKVNLKKKKLKISTFLSCGGRVEWIRACWRVVGGEMEEETNTRGAFLIDPTFGIFQEQTGMSRSHHGTQSLKL